MKKFKIGDKVIIQGWDSGMGSGPCWDGHVGTINQITVVTGADYPNLSYSVRLDIPAEAAGSGPMPEGAFSEESLFHFNELDLYQDKEFGELVIYWKEKLSS